MSIRRTGCHFPPRLTPLRRLHHAQSSAPSPAFGASQAPLQFIKRDIPARPDDIEAIDRDLVTARTGDLQTAMEAGQV